MPNFALKFPAGTAEVEGTPTWTVSDAPSGYNGAYVGSTWNEDCGCWEFSPFNGHTLWKDWDGTQVWFLGSYFNDDASSPDSGTWYSGDQEDSETWVALAPQPTFAYSESGGTPGSYAIGVTSVTSVLNGLTQFTFEGWFKTTNSSAHMAMLVMMDNWVATGGSNGFMIIVNPATNQLYIQYQFGGGWVTNTTMTVTNSADGNWHHFAFCNDGSDMKGYFDGVLKSTHVGATTLTANNSRLVTGAMWNTIFESFFDGVLDQIRISNKSKYSADFSADLPTDLAADSDTIIFYPMNEGSGTTTADKSANSLTLTQTVAGGLSWTWVAGREMKSDVSALVFASD
jgi:hypothetical protein